MRNFGRATKIVWAATGVVGVAAIASCASPPPPPPPTIVELTIKAAPDENPDASGAPAPANVTIYQLAATGSFEKADYFQLAKPEAVLGQDLVAKDQRIVAPGQETKVTIAAKPDTKYLGVVVGYRNIDGSTWRGNVPVPPNKTSPVTATVGKLTLTVAPG